MGASNATDGIERDGRGHPFGFDSQLVGHREDSGHCGIGSGGNEDLPARGKRLNAPCEVHRAADYAILGALLGANMTHYHLSSVNANAHVDVRQAGPAIEGIGGVQA